MKYDPQKHHRRSIRLPNYDYTQPGVYFITIVAYRRELLFGEIANGEMQLNDFGRIADECWLAIPNHFPNTELATHIIMPNHVHGILVINDPADTEESISARRGTIYRAPTEQFQKTLLGSLPTIVRTFKA